MPNPNFSPDEQYLITYIRSPKAASGWDSFMWGYLIAGALMASFAVYIDNISMLILAFVVICGFRIYEANYGNRWTPVWRSIVEKYDAALRGDDMTEDKSEELTSEPGTP